MALMAFTASPASATALYKHITGAKLGTGTVLEFYSEENAWTRLTDTSLFEVNACANSTLTFKITNAGGSGAVTGDIEKLTWSGCSLPTSTTILGKFEIRHIAGTTTGTLTADAEIGFTINTIFFGSCVYGVEKGTELGRLTGAKTVGSELTPPTLEIEAVTKKLSGSNAACPSTARWTGQYFASPIDLTVEAS
jgi:hypothetical protein